MNLKKNRDVLEHTGAYMGLSQTNAFYVPQDVPKSPKSRIAITRQSGDGQQFRITKRPQPEIDPKSQFITQMYGTTSILHPRNKQKDARGLNTSEDLKLLVNSAPDLQHYELHKNTTAVLQSIEEISPMQARESQSQLS
jgi:hypothetical protein